MITYLCNRCDTKMDVKTTKVTSVESNAVRVVKDVPCLECPSCGQIIYEQAVEEYLEQYVSDWTAPAKYDII